MKIDFDKYKALQYCDNEDCKYHNQIGSGNICILSRPNNQVYCNGCRNRWVLTKGTFFYDLRHDFSLILSVLKDLSEGKGQRAIQRTHGISLITQRAWIIKVAEHVSLISDYLEQDMHLERVQIDEFWSFILKKRDVYLSRKAGKLS
jgi:hypothetical protein